MAPNCTRGGSLDMMRNFFMESIVNHWHRLSREAVESPPWMCSKHVDLALKDMVKKKT